MIHVPPNRGKCRGRLGQMAVPSPFCIPCPDFRLKLVSEAPNCLLWRGLCDKWLLFGEERQGVFRLHERKSGADLRYRGQMMSDPCG